MLKTSLLFLLIFHLLASTATGQSCQCSCDEPRPSPQTLSSVKRGKRGAKGERGDAGSKGEKGADRLVEIVSGEERIRVLESTVAQLGDVISQLTKCSVPAIDHVETNTSELRHNEFVHLSCNRSYESEGEKIRKCRLGKLEPDFQTSPFECLPSFKYKLVEQKLTSVEAQSYCEENLNRGQLVMDGIDTIVQRRKVCRETGATTYVHIGFARDNSGGEWRRFDGGPVQEEFAFTWWPGYPKDHDRLQMSCKTSEKFGTMWNYHAGGKEYFICQYK